MAQNGDTQQIEESSKKESRLNAKGRTPPLNFLAILEHIVPPIDTFPVDKLCDQLYNGVFIDPQFYTGGEINDPKYPNTLRYWVDKKLNKNCFALYARELQISWGETPEYWKWTKEKEETSGEEIEVAEIIDVCWLHVTGAFRTTDLSPKTLYEVVFVVKMKQYAICKPPVELTIVLPNYEEISTLRSQVRKESLEDIPREEWKEILVGEFEMSPKNVGQVKFSMCHFDGSWKKGLVLKCVIFQPKKNK